MKILHVASFDGNIGDNASHLGFASLLRQATNEEYVVDQLEMRRFYNNYSLANKCRFDSNFTEKANSYDLLVIGGGGFLDFDIKGSGTGTTIDLTKEVLDQLEVPVMITSIGSNPRNTIPEGNIEKFRSFLDAYLDSDNRFLAVRNDGSKQVLAELVGKQYHDAIPEVLDHGFFYENDGSYYRPCEQDYVLINTTVDQVQMKNRQIGTVDEALYLSEMSKVIDHIISETDYQIVFAPHIYSDYKAIDALLKNVNDFNVRTRIVITPYAQGNYGCNQIFSAYKNSSLVIGMRFHANVCSMGMDVPNIGLAVLDRVKCLYENMGVEEDLIIANKPFGEKLITRMHQILTADYSNHAILPKLLKKRQDTVSLYKQFLKKTLSLSGN